MNTWPYDQSYTAMFSPVRGGWAGDCGRTLAGPTVSRPGRRL